MIKSKDYFYISLFVLFIFTSLSCARQDQISGGNAEPTLIPTVTTRPPATLTEEILTIDGTERIYFLRIPAGVDPANPAPVVFAFHGMGEKARDMYKAGFNSVADEEGFILVYPELLSHSSTEFIMEVLHDVRGIVNVDPKSIYAMGFSLGGKLTYHAACDLADTFAAFGSVAGMAICENGPASDRAVPIIHIHGLGDDLVPYDTGRYGMPPVEETIKQWVEFNQCVIPPGVEINEKITHISYPECRDGADVELYTVDGLGHRVPIKEFPAARVIWEFFEAHPLP